MDGADPLGICHPLEGSTGVPKGDWTRKVGLNWEEDDEGVDEDGVYEDVGCGRSGVEEDDKTGGKGDGREYR